jgi:serine protease Do
MDARIKNIIEQLRQGREIEYAFIGVQLDRPTAAQRRMAGSPEGVGVLIKEVTPGAPAEGQLQVGDIVVAFNDEEVRDVDHLIRLVGSAAVGKPSDIRAYRNGHLITTTVTPARKAVLKGVRIEAPLAWRGMTIADLTDDLREKYKLDPAAEGVVVTQVEADGPAGRVGLKEGSLIRRVADQTLTGVRQLRELLPRLEGPVPVQAGDPATEITLP